MRNKKKQFDLYPGLQLDLSVFLLPMISKDSGECKTSQPDPKAQSRPIDNMYA